MQENSPRSIDRAIRIGATLSLEYVTADPELWDAWLERGDVCTSDMFEIRDDCDDDPSCGFCRPPYFELIKIEPVLGIDGEFPTSECYMRIPAGHAVRRFGNG